MDYPSLELRPDQAAAIKRRKLAIYVHRHYAVGFRCTRGFCTCLVGSLQAAT